MPPTSFRELSSSKCRPSSDSRSLSKTGRAQAARSPRARWPRADPDGYTLLAHSSAHIIAPSTVANLQYDPIKDFVAVAPLGNLPNVLVIAPSKNIKTVQELVAEGKKRPITFGSIGVGSPIHMAMERLRLSAGFKAEAIPFKGAPEALVEVMTGRVDVYYSPVLAALSFIKEGKVVPLAVSSPTRSATLPDVPTTLESGYPNSAYRFWIGVFAPAQDAARYRQQVERGNPEGAAVAVRARAARRARRAADGDGWPARSTSSSRKS